MKILITGASGKIGQELVTALAAKNQLVLLSRGDVAKKAGIITYTTELTDTKVLEDIFQKEKPEVVIHLAAILPQQCNDNPSLAEEINVIATKNLGSLADKHSVKKFIFTSTAGVYLQKTLEPTDEMTHIDPQSVYAKTKLLAEHSLEEISKKSQTQFVVFRIFNVYGKSFTDSLIYKLTHSDNNTPVGLCGPDNFYRDYVHVSDVIAAFQAIVLAKLTESFIVINIASGVATSNTNLLKQLDKAGTKPHYIINDCPESFSRADIQKAKTLFGFNPSRMLIIKN